MAFEKQGIKPVPYEVRYPKGSEKGKKTQGEKIREKLEKFKDKSPKRKPGEKKEMIPLAKGGRAMYKSGSKGCKLAMKGKGRAYGKNS